MGDDYRELRGEIAGPPDTPYEGATFQLEIKVPETYPFNPPKVTWCMAGGCVSPFLLEKLTTCGFIIAKEEKII